MESPADDMNMLVLPADHHAARNKSPFSKHPYRGKRCRARSPTKYGIYDTHLRSTPDLRSHPFSRMPPDRGDTRTPL